MKKYDVIVIGTGSGMSIAQRAAKEGFSVALVDKGPTGGTCLNVGCTPTKLMISAADKVMEIRESDRFGIKSDIVNVDFEKIMHYMRDLIIKWRKSNREAIDDSIDYYEKEAHFTDDYTLAIGDQTIRGEKIFIASGARPLIPPIEGLDDYYTNESILELDEAPESLGIIGGGYVAAELAHFFEAMGTKVTVFQRGSRMLKDEDIEVSKLIAKELGKRVDILTDSEVKRVQKTEDGYKVFASDKATKVQKILVAAGRESNADLLRVENSGIETDEKGYIKIDKHFQTTKEDIYALGDATGKQMFTHSSRMQAPLVWKNATNDEKQTFDFGIVPHAVYTWPQIASIGLTEEDAKKDHDVMIGKACYSGDTTKGSALRQGDAFAKIITDKDKNLLGFSVIGPYAPMLIQEVNAAFKYNDIGVLEAMHIHPSMSELVQAALRNLE